MTPGGLCFQCREMTSRYDDERQRWACRSCWPHLLRWEAAYAAAKDAGAFESPTPWGDKPPGMSRQEWRRRMRGGA